MYEYDWTRTVTGATPQQCFDVVTDPTRATEWVSMANEVREGRDAEQEPRDRRDDAARPALEQDDDEQERGDAGQPAHVLGLEHLQVAGELISEGKAPRGEDGERRDEGGEEAEAELATEG